MDFPAGTVTVDPRGAGGTYYDRPFKRWLPVNRYAVLPDGTRYASTEFKVPGTAHQQRLHLIDVPTGKDRIYTLVPYGSSEAYVVVALVPEGVWLAHAPYESPSGGLSFLDAATGVLKDTGIEGIWDAVAGEQGVFWYTDPGPNPQSGTGMGGLLPAEVRRLTISDGKNVVWFAKPGFAIQMLGTDLAGHPVIHASSDSAQEVRVIMSPTFSKSIGLPGGFYTFMADSHGMWFAGQDGIYLYTEAMGVRKVSDRRASLAGACE